MSRITLIGISVASCGIGVTVGANHTRIKKALYRRYDGRSSLQLKSSSHNVFPVVSAARSYVPDAPSNVQTGINSRTEEIMRFGFPGFDNIRSYGDYVISYDNRTRNARWVFEHLTSNSVKYVKGIDRSESEFVEDSSIHPYFRATNADFRGTRFDRGHLAAAANHRFNQSAMDKTFLLSNVAPQVGVDFNRGAWNQLEKFVRGLTKNYPNVYVCTGPLYLPRHDSGRMFVRYEVIGRNHVAVPSHFFKVIAMEKPRGAGFDLLSFVMPNEPLGEKVDLRTYQVPIDSVERAAGFLLFEKIPRRNVPQII